MAKTAILSVRIVGDAKRAVASFNEAAGGLDKLESNMKKAATGATVVGGAVVALAKQALDSASALQQSTGAVEAVFKSQSDSIKALAADAANSVGLSANQYQEFAAVMGAQLKNLGVEQSALVPTTEMLISMGADLASMYGGTTADAVSALGAVFRGETDPIEQYGIAIKQSDVNARMAADGLDKLEGEAAKQAETQTRINLLTEQAADALGNFARETDTAAGSAQIAAAHWENAKAALGEQLLPVATQAAQALAELAKVIGENPEKAKQLALAIGVLVGSLYGGLAAIKAWRITTAIATTVSTAWGAMTGSIVFGNKLGAHSSASAASTSMAAWVGAAIRTMAAWVAFGVRAAASFVATAAKAVASAAMASAAWVGAALRTSAAWVASAASTAAAWVAFGVRAAASFVATAASAVASAASTAAAWVASAARTAAAFVAQTAAMAAVRGATMAYAAAQWVLNAALSANPIGLIIGLIAGLVAGLVLAYQKSDTFRNAVDNAWSVAKPAFSSIASAVGNVVSAFSPLLSVISRVIGALASIRFPSPPAWMSKMFSGGLGPSAMLGVPPDSGIFRFMAPPTMTFAGTPDLTAAANPLAGGGLGLLSRAASGTVTVDNSLNITVDGSGIVDARRVAEAIREALRTDNRTRGRGPAAGGGSWL